MLGRRVAAACAALWLGASICVADLARAEAPLEEIGQVATLPEIGPHTVWVADLILGHSLLFDGDSGEVLATIDGGKTISPKPPLHHPTRDEIYSVEIDYSRGNRGERVDYVTIYDAKSLEVTGEVVLPTRTSESAASLGYAALLDGGRFLATFNQFPETSVSIVDLQRRRFVGEIVTGGCAGIFATGERSFGMLCGSGSVLSVDLDAQGRKASMEPTERFFDVVEDPLMMSGARIGSRWIFVSFAGEAYEVDFAQSPPAVDSWWLTNDSERKDGWRPGGRQNVTLHQASGRLYVAFHQGGPGTHKDPGPEVRVFDVATRSRVARIEMPNFTSAFLGSVMGLEGGFVRFLMDTLIPGGGADTIAVSQDEEPVLFARNSQRGVVAVLDARTGEHLRNLDEPGFSGSRLTVPR